MDIEFTIPEILRMAGIVYAPGLGNKLNTLLNAPNEIAYQSALYEVTKEIFYGDSYFPELPKFLPLTIGKNDVINEDLLLESAIVEISNTKNIVSTAIQGRDGTVKEFISNGDYQVSVQGSFAFKGLDWPRDNVALLRQFMEAGMALKVTHEVLNALGIYEIVVTDWSLPQTSFVNIIPYKINAVSDWPIDFTDEYKKLKPVTPKEATFEG
jgi:hypothetical protein